jgi:threonine aldolase
MKKNKILIGTDTISGIHPKILEVISIASKEKTLPYGNDIFTKECKDIISKVFEKEDLEILPMISGTASNSLALSSFLRSYGSVLCHAQSHINKDEGGAPEFFSCGGKLIPIANILGRVTANELNNKIEEINFKGKQSFNICGVSITQLAENGTVYTSDEIIEISKICKKNNLYLHMDGARFSNALAFQKHLSPAEMTWKVGVDCLSLGATKNGAMAAEVIIFFDKELAIEAKKLVKQTGHVLSKTRFISAQLNAWFKNGLWIKLAKKANSKAKYLSSELSKFKQFRLIYETQANEIFVEISKNTYEEMLDLNIISNLWSSANNGNYIVRFVTSFETEKSEIDELLLRIKTFCSRS